MLRSLDFVCFEHHHLHHPANRMSTPDKPEPATASPMPEGVTDPTYRPLPGQLGNMTMTQVHTLDKFKKELKADGKFVEERMSDQTLLRYPLVLLSFVLAFFFVISTMDDWGSAKLP